jgi:LysR family transcriptional regulator for metE and metH
VDLEVRHLRLVAGIADAGSMTKAAAHLHLTQSALSHQLRDIESRFNLPFFLRAGRRMVLTAAGRRVLSSARTVLEDLRRAEEDLRRLASNSSGVIRVCTQCNTGYYWLPPLLATFARKHPHVDVSIIPDATDRPVDALLDGRVDLAILTTPSRDARVLVRALFKDEMIAVVARNHALAERTWLSPRQLAAEHLLLYSSAPDESFTLTSILGPAGLVPARVSFIMLTEAMLEMARAGLGVGVLPRWSAQAAIGSGAVVPLSIGRRGVRREWCAATLRAQTEPAWLTDFVALIKSQAGPGRRENPRVASA